MIDSSIPKMISDKELERMIDSGEVVIVQNGNTLTVRKATAQDKMRYTLQGNNPVYPIG